jgi:signal transduction histidine kinase
VALWSAGRCELRRVPPDRYSPPVTESLERMPFMCRDVGAADARVLVATPDGLRERRGRPVDDGLRADFGMRAVLALPLSGDALAGWLFYLDKSLLSTDDIALGTITAREIVRSLSQAEMVAIERQTAVTDERTRLGRDLHDGLLQSLTAVRLQLHQLSRQAATGSANREKLQAVEASIAANQRELRRLVEDLRPREEACDTAPAALADDLEELRARVRQEWSLETRASVDSRVHLPPGLGREVHLMVHEALVNAARHGGATLADVAIAHDRERLTVTVADNGRGFPFSGRRNAVELECEHAGPVSLRERVLSLNGELVIESSASGARVEMTIPLDRGA